MEKPMNMLENKKNALILKQANHVRTPLHLLHETWFDYLQILFHRNIRSLSQKFSPGHKNAS